MIDYYIHQIGSIKDNSTYKRLLSILESKKIYSREYLERQGIDYDSENPSFTLNGADNEDPDTYYQDDIHRNRVSLSDPRNIFINRSIKNKYKKILTCFDYNYIAFAISRDVPIVPNSNTKGLASGEVQVQGEIDTQYIVGLILPFPKEKLSSKTKEIVRLVERICEDKEFPLDIYNYEGDIISEKSSSLKRTA